LRRPRSRAPASSMLYTASRRTVCRCRSARQCHRKLTDTRSRHKTDGRKHRLGHDAILQGQPVGPNAGNPARPSAGRRLLLVGGRRHVGDADRLLEDDGRRVVQRGHHASDALASRPGQGLHAAQRYRLARQRRPGLLGHVGHAGRREQVPQSARRQAAVAGPGSGRLQHASEPRPARRHLQRRAAVADSLLEQRI